jgi:hypothetical protein
VSGIGLSASFTLREYEESPRGLLSQPEHTRVAMTTNQSAESSGGASSGRSIAGLSGKAGRQYTIVGEARRGTRRAVSLRLLLVMIATLSLVFAAVKQALVSWDLHRRIPASQRLLLPLITWHELHAEGNRLSEREELKLVRSRSKRLGEEFRLAVRSMRRMDGSFRVPTEFRYFWKYLKSLTVNPPGHGGPTVLENYQTSVWNSHMATYHDHMKSHYEKLLSELWTELPPMPAALEAELRACEAEIRRIRHNPALDLYPETAPDLRPGAPKAKAIPWNGSWPDSF